MEQTPKNNPPKRDSIPSHPEHIRAIEAQVPLLLQVLQKMSDEFIARLSALETRLSALETRWSGELALSEKKTAYLISLLLKSRKPGA
jgi:hypothetical protein